jgi:hypothetical protein
MCEGAISARCYAVLVRVADVYPILFLRFLPFDARCFRCMHSIRCAICELLTIAPAGKHGSSHNLTSSPLRNKESG